VSKTLYLLRRHPNEISRALFHASDPGVEVVLIEEAASRAFSYDDLVRKVFEADRVVVI